MTDKELVQQFQQGNRASFTELHKRYHALIYKLCFNMMMGQREEAEDRTQEAFINAYRYLKKFRGDASFKTWLYKVATNVCLNRLKSAGYKMQKRSRSTEEEISETYTLGETLRSNRKGPRRISVEHEVWDILINAINQLDNKKRMVIVLSDVEGFSYKEIVEITGIRMQTVKSTLHRAREKVAKMVKGHINYELL